MWRRARSRGVAGVLAGLVTGALLTGVAPDARAAPVARAGAVESGREVEAADGVGTTEAAQAEARRTGKPVEVTSLRGETSDVHATADGALEAREYLRPVRARVGEGWKPVDTDLVKAADGAVAPKVATVGLEFSGGGDVPLVRMEKAGRKLALSWPGKLPEPTLDGDTATYQDVLPDVDLRMGAQADGFTQLLVVKSAKAAASSGLAELRLKLAADGMDVKETAEGGVEATDQGADGAVFEAPAPMMWDSSTGADSAPAGPSARMRRAAPESAAGDESPQAGQEQERASGESGKLAPVGLEVPDGGKELVLTPDQDVLKGEDTQYPVFIDPQWYSPRASAWTMASKYWASSPQWKFNGDRDAGLGYCNWYYCKPHDTKRLFYRIPVSRFAGKSILSAEFVVRNKWSASCSDRTVELWETKGISSSTTWNSQNASGFWKKKLSSKSFAYGYSGCAAKDAEFSVKSAVQSAANGKASTMTFGLRAGSESDAYGWKRFSDRAFLRVKYNRPPSQLKMSQLSMEYGGVCKRPDKAARVRTLGKIYAKDVTDPDKDSVSVQFQAKWDAGDGKGTIARWKPGRTSAKKSGSDFSISLPKSIPTNKSIHWYVRSYDGAQYSPWSYAGDPTGCYFVYDTKVPKAPSVSSGEYPVSDPEDPGDPWNDGVGKYGAFELKAADKDVTSYRYGINGDPSSKNEVSTSSGGAKSVQVLPARPGLNFVTAQAFDAAGNGSEIRTYQFRVRAGQPERATWQLDEPKGAAQAKGSTPARALQLHGGATPGVSGVRGSAVSFNGSDGYAATDIPVVDTSRGFAVSAWAKLSRMPEGAAVIATQPGNHSPGFELYYSKAYDRWAFNQYKSDSADAGIARVMADKPGGVSVGKWTHLVGSYDSVRDVLELYVGGKKVGETAYSKPWEARRGLQLGAASYSGKPSAFFPGAVDEVQLFDKPLAQDEVDKLRAHESVGDPGRPAVAVFGLDEAADAKEVSGHGGVLPATYSGGVTTGVTGVAGKAARFDGSSGYARIGRSSGPHVNTSRSFTVSAWARLDTKPDGAAIITAQAGKDRPGFELYYSSAYDRWAFNQYSADSADAKPIRAMQPEGTKAYTRQWVHLVGVHDTVADTLTLYVNGSKAGSAKLGGAFYADQSLYLGAGSYSGQVTNHFPGRIDDVRLLDRPVSADEVRQMFQQRPLVKGRWNFEETSGSSPAGTPDLSGEEQEMRLYGGAKLGPGMVDAKGLQLNGTSGYASMYPVPVDTSGSFTVTAWAQAAALPKRGVSLVSGQGEKESAFSVRFVPDAKDPEGLGRWELTVPDKDGSDATVTRVSNSDFNDAREWNHLAVVYDGFAKQARLYVNGSLQEVACGDADGDGDADESGCQDLISWSDNTLAFKATKALQVGREKTGGAWGGYFPGAVDDVWAFQGALSDDQIEWLAGQWDSVPTEVPRNS
ncbi:LamG-like jellyroll fold domain-containing protein [Streptomyces flavofungini]|uniref:LamG-like jellyroll fold domain-containing protein n=1 Tax=Streptomyces flavofungini TaxID=68200 RepID=UPI0025AFE34A|nr:LamG-like jellyroll fold domain-containing protein [Streptomyces flavofungini]WJV45854.1 DNRLRE domain-containing protein [Streptomyces flavofungini]